MNFDSDPEFHLLKTVLTRGKEATLQLPQTLNRKDFELLVRWLEQLQEAFLYEEDSFGDS
jgi:hypothetical protein